MIKRIATSVLLVLACGCGKGRESASVPDTSAGPAVSASTPAAAPAGPLTYAAASAFSVQLTRAMQACESAAAPGGAADNVMYFPASVSLKPGEGGGPPTSAEFNIRRSAGGGQNIFLLELSRPAGHWTYVSGTFRNKGDDTPVDAEAGHPWVRKAVEDAQQ